MRTMAYNRYNTLTFWSSHPYDHMVRLKKYPEATTLSQDRLDKNIRLLPQALSDGEATMGRHLPRDLEHPYRAGVSGKAHNVRDGQDSPLIRDYEKECIRELLREYPGTDGHGDLPRREHADVGRGQRRVDSRRLSRHACQNRPQNPVHLSVLGSPAERNRGHARTEPIIRAKSCWTSSLTASTCTRPPSLIPRRWAGSNKRPNPTNCFGTCGTIASFNFAGATRSSPARRSSNCGGPDSAGFVTGSEIEIPGVDRYHTPQTVAHRNWKYEFEKNWMRFAVWGRMGYDPKLPDDYWIARFSERFGPAAGKDAFLALKYASKIIPLDHLVPLELHERRLVSRRQHRQVGILPTA